MLVFPCNRKLQLLPQRGTPVPSAVTPSRPTHPTRANPPPQPAMATSASDPTAPEEPLLFLHPGDGFEPLALPAAPGCALLLGGGGLGADGRRAFEEGLHGCGWAEPGPAVTFFSQAVTFFSQAVPSRAVRPSTTCNTQTHRPAGPTRPSRQPATGRGRGRFRLTRTNHRARPCHEGGR